MEKPEFASLRAEIRHIVDNAETWLTSPQIYALMTLRSTPQVFGVTIAQMIEAQQLRKRKAPKHSGVGVRFAYGPGPMPVSGKQYRADRPERVKGFMAMKREREARQRGSRRANA